MNARFAHVLSRLSIVSVVALSSAGLVACSRATTTTTQEAPAEVQAEPAASPGPGRQLFREIEGLDLRDAQREAVAEVEQNLRADMAPHRETARQVALALADAFERGEVDPAVVATQKAALRAAADDIHASIAGAMDQVHDVLDAEQRADLVARLVARHEAHEAGRGDDAAAHHHQAFARFAAQLGLTDEQQKALREAVQQGADDLFPDRKARRAEWQARMKALAEGFVRDDFNAEDYEIGGHADEAIEKAGEVAERAIDVGGTVLGASQRKILADMLRERAARR